MPEQTVHRAPTSPVPTPRADEGTAAGGEVVEPLSRLGMADAGRAGGKGANLGEMLGAGFPVPDGFVVMAGAFRAAMQAGGVDAELTRHYCIK
jgi:pyruvate,water dikinase